MMKFGALYEGAVFATFHPMNILLFLAGAMCIAAAIRDWDWFFENFRASLFVRLFGRDGARVFYALLGAFIMFAAAFTRWA